MLTKEYSITLDMIRENAFRPFEVVECDTGNVLHILLQNDGVPMDLADCYVCIVFASKLGFAIQDDTNGLSLGEDTGEIDVCLRTGSYGTGEVTADVQVYSGEERDTLITSKRFTFRCVTALMSDEIIAASKTYPPLISATKAANDAAEAALDAVAQIGTVLGEMNVQPDWNETDVLADAYIKNRPAAYAPSAHAASHAAGGADPITVGTAANLPVFTGTGGALGTKTAAEARTLLGVTPANIGAAKTSAKTTATLAVAAWAGTAAPFTYTLSVSGVTATNAVEVLPAANITAAQLEALQGANIVGGTQSAGSIVLRAFGDKPAVALPVQIIVRGDL